MSRRDWHRRAVRSLAVAAALCLLGVAFVGVGAAGAPDCSTVGYDQDGSTYLVTNLSQLQCIGENHADATSLSDALDNDYRLTSDIDAAETENWNGGDGFNPIGNLSDKFEGTFDGDGYVVNDLYIDRSALAADAYYVGLFGYAGTSCGEIREVGVDGGEVSGYSEVGGLVGRNVCPIVDSYANVTVNGSHTSTGGLVGAGYADITDSHANGTVDGDTYVGGLIGQWGASSSTISNSSATGDVNGSSSVGGFVGSASKPIEKSYATGNVTAADDGNANAGGFAGQISSGSAVVEKSYATGDVDTPGDRVGGFVGYMKEGYYDNAPTLDRVYAVGQVNGSSDVGGVVGNDSSSSDATTNAYWDIDTTNQSDGVGTGGGDVTGYNTSEMHGANATDNLDALAFPGTWHATDTYPALAWQDTTPFYGVNITSTDSPIDAGTNLTVTANITNWASDGAAQTVALNDTDFSDTQQNSTSVTLSSGASQSVTLSWNTTASDAGTGNVTMATANASDDSEVTLNDATAPTISNVSLAEDSGDVNVTFDADEQLGTSDANVTANVTGPNGKTYSFNRSEFSESGSGPYTYTLSSTQAYDDGNGSYTLSIDDAEDSAGNNGGNDGTGSGLSTTYTYGTAVVSTDLRYISGPATNPSNATIGSNVTLQTTLSGQALSVELFVDDNTLGPGEKRNLSRPAVGFTEETTVQLLLNVSNYDPDVMMGPANATAWNVSGTDANGHRTITVTHQPTQVQRNFSASSNPSAWSSSNPSYEPGWEQAEVGVPALVYLQTYQFPGGSSLGSSLDGARLNTDAQAFTTPKQGPNGELRFDVAAPHCKASAASDPNDPAPPDKCNPEHRNTDGFYEAVVPSAYVSNAWGSVSTGDMVVLRNESGTVTPVANASVSKRPSGALFVQATGISYSPPTLEVAEDTTDPTADAGSDQTVSTGESATLDGSSSSDNTALDTYEWDTDDDGTYEKSGETPTHTYDSAGDRTVTLRVTDAAGNTDTDTVTITVEGSGSSNPGGGGGGGGTPVDEDEEEETTDEADDSEPEPVAEAEPDVTVEREMTDENPETSAVEVGFEGTATVEQVQLEEADAGGAVEVREYHEPPESVKAEVSEQMDSDAGTGSDTDAASGGNPSVVAAAEISPPDEAETSSATVELSVDRDEVTDPENLVVTHRDDQGHWERLETSVAAVTDEQVRVTGHTESFSLFAVVEESPESTPTPTPTATPRATPTPAATPESTTPQGEAEETEIVVETPTPTPVATQTPSPQADGGSMAEKLPVDPTVLIVVAVILVQVLGALAVRRMR